MKKLTFILLFIIILIPSLSYAGCDDPLGDGVDYTNCRFSDGQNLEGSYLPNSNLSFTSFFTSSIKDLSLSTFIIKPSSLSISEYFFMLLKKLFQFYFFCP